MYKLITENQTAPGDQLTEQENQYSLVKILLIWAGAALPMAFLAWVVTPLLIPHINLHPGIVFWLMMIVGLIWQCVFSLVLVRNETGNLKWYSIRQRMWYNKPKDPETGKSRNSLFWWVIPFLFLSGVLQVIPLPEVMSSIFPFIDNLPQYDMADLATPEYKGAWWLIGIYLIHMPLNYFLGEEFLFRGILLPKMSGVFGKWDWFTNGVLFGFYHLSKPHIIFWSALTTGLLFSYPSKRFRSNWMAVIIHGAEGVFILFLILGIVLGVT